MRAALPLLLLLAAAAAALAAAAAAETPRFDASHLANAPRFELVAVPLDALRGSPARATLRIDALRRNLTVDLRRADGLVSDRFVATWSDDSAPLHADTSRPEACHYHGTVRGHPGSSVALSACGGSLDGFLSHKGGRWIVQPARHHARFAGAPREHHVVYREADLELPAHRARPHVQACAAAAETAPDRHPPQGCKCRDTWSYAGKTFCGGVCADPTEDPGGAWCYTEGECSGSSWAYCTETAPQCAEERSQFDDFAPPEGEDCECRDTWTYEGVTVCGGRCENPANGDYSPWCYTKGSCNGQSWTFCQEKQTCQEPRSQFANLVPTADGCQCKEQWEYAGRTTCGRHCEDPDNDPNGAWCYTDGAQCSKRWSYCAAPADEERPEPEEEENGGTSSDGQNGGDGAANTGVIDTGSNRNVELLLVVDESQFRSLGSSLDNAKNYAVAVANTVRELYRAAGLNIVVHATGVHTFTTPAAEAAQDLSTTAAESIETYLRRFTTFQHKLQGHFTATLASCTAGSDGCIDLRHDNAQLLTGVDRSGGTTGLAWVGTICGSYSAGVDEAVLAQAFVADTVAHELGHNLGAQHDSDGNNCAESGDVMAAVSTTSSGGTKSWSGCSKAYFTNKLQELEASGASNCLQNQPTVSAASAVCGNGIREGDEECDLGSGNGLSGAACTSKCGRAEGAQCGSGVCCDTQTGRFKSSSAVCRPSNGQCDVAEYCSGSSSQCPADRSKVDGTSCTESGAGGRCYLGGCKALDAQCKAAWSGYQGTWVAGGRNGQAGECRQAEDGCGELSCTNQEWDEYCFPYECPAGYTCTYDGVSFAGLATRHFCKCLVTETAIKVLVQDGTPCGTSGEDKICLSRRCVSRPAASVAVAQCSRERSCSGHGDCVEIGETGEAGCACDAGFTGETCAEKYQCPFSCDELKREPCRALDSCGECLPGFASNDEQFGPYSSCDLEARVPAEALASSALGGTAAAHAHDGDRLTAWQARFDTAAIAAAGAPGGADDGRDPSQDGALPVLELQYDEAFFPSRYELTSAGSQPSMDPAEWRLEASSDGSRWQTIDDRLNVRFGGRARTLPFAVKASPELEEFTRYRFVFTGILDAEFQGTGTVDVDVNVSSTSNDTRDGTLGNVTQSTAYVPRMQLAEAVLYKGVPIGEARSGGGSSGASTGLVVGLVVGVGVFSVAAALVAVQYRKRQRASDSKAATYMGTDLPMAPEERGTSSAAGSLMSLAAVTPENVGGGAAAAAAGVGGEDLGPLPPGWEEFADDSGAPYFYHAETNTTQWDRPRE